MGDLSRHPAQDQSKHNGTTVRLHDDGRVPADNPFVGKSGVLPEIYTYGHRNAQGMAVHPITGDVWQNEHGPQGGDELNVIRPGLNYGWPVVGYGVNYTTGRAIHEGTQHEGMEPPRHVWVPSIGVSGMLFYTADTFARWKGDMLVGGLSGQRLVRSRIDGQKVVSEETLLQRMGRIARCAAGAGRSRLRGRGRRRPRLRRETDADSAAGAGRAAIDMTGRAAGWRTRGLVALLASVAVHGGTAPPAGRSDCRRCRAQRPDADARDSVVLRADVWRPAGESVIPRWSTARPTARPRPATASWWRRP